ncbi:Pleiotropic drug resistance protein 2 [Phytophthora cinnamomi]|uniref:Pleiotropic drug resistance protein 2 n=1 Tax=Phytophthora cinnamomi TaxID=4785 RepID=UPI00355A60F1|nr:Pleiotropic drug resistance protein 2 [Phytophthora cinnamomi]
MKHRFAQGSPMRSPFGSPMSSAAGFVSPQPTSATRGLKITAYASPESGKVAKSASSESAGFASPPAAKVTRSATSTTTSYSSPVTTKTISYSSPSRTQSSTTAGSTTTRKITVEGDFTVITTEVTSPRGTKRVSTTRQPTSQSGLSTTAA